MNEVERSKTSNNTLIPYTNDGLANDKKVFKAFVDWWTDVNPNINKTDCETVKNRIEKHKVKAKEFEEAIGKAYDDPNRYGKVEWNDIWKHIKAGRESKSHFRPDAVHL